MIVLLIFIVIVGIITGYSTPVLSGIILSGIILLIGLIATSKSVPLRTEEEYKQAVANELKEYNDIIGLGYPDVIPIYMPGVGTRYHAGRCPICKSSLNTKYKEEFSHIQYLCVNNPKCPYKWATTNMDKF